MKNSRPAKTPLEDVATHALHLFQGLPSACLRAIEERSKIQHFPAGHVFFNTGQIGKGLFLLEQGAVQTFRTSGVKKLIIADLKAPAIFGEMGCVGQCVYHCSAQTTGHSRIRMISRANLDDLLDQYPIVTRRLLDLATQRFVSVLMDLDTTSFRQLIPRLAVGTALTRLSRISHCPLGKLKKAGIVEIRRKQIRILHHARLERAARE